MPSDDRDQLLERALKRHLGPASQEAECPDAEMLAAYHQRTLSLDEMARWKEHFQTCAQCQETLALLEATDNVVSPEPIGQQKLSSEDEKISDRKDSNPQPEELFELALPAMAARSAAPGDGAAEVVAENAAESTPQPEVVMASVPIVGSSYTESPSGKRSRVRRTLQWLVPVGAIAAAVTIWFAVHETRSPLFGGNEVAENREAAPEVPPAPLSDSRELNKTQSESPAASSADSQSLTQEEKAPAQAQPPPPLAQSAPQLSQQEKELDRDAFTAKQEGAIPEGARRSRSLGTDSVRPQNSGNAPAAAAPATAPAIAGQPSAPSKSYNSSTAMGGLVASRQEQNLLKQKKDQTAQMELSASAAAVRSVAAGDRSVIVAPGYEQIWIAKTGGKVSHSSDTGKTWTPQTTGVTADLLTGAAPNNSVVWIVGKAGTILVTTDGGSHWRTVTSPISGNLGGVRASDANHATVWDESNSKTFQTKDGGAHWTPVVNE